MPQRYPVPGALSRSSSFRSDPRRLRSAPYYQPSSAATCRSRSHLSTSFYSGPRIPEYVIKHGDPLHNDSPTSIKYKRKEYPTGGHLYQSLKSLGRCSDTTKLIRLDKARPLADGSVGYSQFDWDEMKVKMMVCVLKLKLRQYPILKSTLLETGTMKIIYYSEDRFLGVGADGYGRNEVGNALEQIREELRRNPLQRFFSKFFGPLDEPHYRETRTLEKPKHHCQSNGRPGSRAHGVPRQRSQSNGWSRVSPTYRVPRQRSQPSGWRYESQTHEVPRKRSFSAMPYGSNNYY